MKQVHRPDADEPVIPQASSNSFKQVGAGLVHIELTFCLFYEMIWRDARHDLVVARPERPTACNRRLTNCQLPRWFASPVAR